MIHVNILRNPLDQTKREQRTADAGTTLRSLTIEINGGASEWPFPTVAIVDGKPWMRGRWNEPLSDGMVVEFRSMLKGDGSAPNFAIGGAMFLGGAALTIASFGTLAPLGIGLMLGGAGMLYAGYKIRGMPDAPSVPSSLSGESGSPTYAIDYTANRKRVGEPIPVVYGTHRLVPDLVTQSYAYFNNNEQYVAMVLALGIGEFAVDTTTLKFGEALFSELSGISYQIVPPGSSLTLANLSDHVSVSGAINGQTLVGTSQGTVIAYEYPLVSIDWIESGGTGTSRGHLKISPEFGIVNGNMVTISGSLYNDGNYQVVNWGGTGDMRLYPWAGGYVPERPSEHPTIGSILISINGVAQFPTSPAVTFTNTGTNVGTIAVVAGAFAACYVGETIAASNTVNNDRSYLITEISPDKSTVTVAGPIVSETAEHGGLYVDDSGYIGWFECATLDDEVQSIECDFVCPRGVGTINGSGGVDSRTITAEIQYQGVTAGGVPTGSILTTTYAITAASATAVRRSYKFANDTGYPRVRIRGRRTTTESTVTSALDTITWTGLKAYLPAVTTYPGVTVLAVLAKATEQLTAQQSGQVSVVATKKVPVWNGSTWSAPVARNSIAWAIADVLRNTETGVGLSDSQIDLAGLLALDTIWSGRGDEFNGVFDQTITAWEAVQKIARCGRAIPVMVNGSITFVRDGEKTVRSAIFNPSNINPGSLRIEYAFKKEHDPDGVDLTWINQASWQRDVVAVAMPGVVGDATRPEGVDLFGCTNIDQATREATYLARRMAYIRKTISWQTEMDGRLLMVGDLVALAHDVPSWSQSGEVIGFTDNGGTCDYLTSQPINWTALGTKYVLLKKQDGSVSGPHTATEITGGFRIADPSWVPNSTLENGERTTFVLYVGSSIDVVITDITPSGDTTATITGVPYDARIHASGA